MHSLIISTSRPLFAAICLAAALAGQAQSVAPAPQLPAVVVTGTRTPRAVTTLGGNVDFVSAAELERRQITSLPAALGGVAGAPVFASGQAGASASLFLRGANSNQTLFLVDGIRLNDPNTDYAVTLGGAGVLACDSLEVAHGPQSTLYGGEAVGGVVALRAQRGAGAPAARASIEAGSFGTVQGAVAAQGERGPWAYSFSAGGVHTDNNRANNALDGATVALRLDRRLNDRVALGATGRGFIGRYGDPGDRFTNDPDNGERENNHLATVFADFTPSAEWTSRIVLGGQDRRFVSENPTPRQATQVTVVKNRRGVLDWQNTVTLDAHHRLTAGVTAETNHTRNNGFGEINRKQTLFAVFAQDEWTPVENLFLTAGLRSDDHDTFGRATTGRTTLAWLAPGSRWKLRASYGTAFRSPAFLDLYGVSAYYRGNPRLRPEHAAGWDAGMDYYVAGGRGTVSATWFDTRHRDLIAYDFAVFPGTTANVERARTQGVELSAMVSPAAGWEARLAYTYLEAENLSLRSRLLRRPRHSGSTDLWHNFGHGFSAGAGVGIVAQREDVNARTFATIDGEDYTVARIYAAWRVNDRLTVRARIENVLNESHEEVHGYPAAGRGLFAGIEWRF